MVRVGLEKDLHCVSISIKAQAVKSQARIHDYKCFQAPSQLANKLANPYRCQSLERPSLLHSGEPS